jgi:alpha-glucosidase
LSFPVKTSSFFTRVESKKSGSGTVVIEKSPLGLIRLDGDFSTGMSFVSESETKPIRETYTMLSGKQSRIQVDATEKTFTFANKTGAQLQIIVRMSADGAAFRYRFPEKNDKIHTVTGETTGFNLPPTAMPG